MQLFTPRKIDIAIVGAGPQALTLVTHLLQKKSQWGSRLMIFDASGTWLSQWKQQFYAQEIPHLRSPAVHHPDPNPYGLRSFAENRPLELFAPYDVPGTKLFEDFCSEVVQRWGLQNRVYPGKVVQILPLNSRRGYNFRLVLDKGESLVARRVVLATNYGKVQLPDWVTQIPSPYPSERLCHSTKINLPSLHLQGEKILIIGGGLTSGHLAMGAIKRGAKVVLMGRRKFQAKLFDADPGWLGPKYLKGFYGETNQDKKWELIQQARNGGSLTPKMMLQLRKNAKEGKIELLENCEIVKARWQKNKWLISCSTGEVDECDARRACATAHRIWLATGTKFDAASNPLLSDILEAYPSDIVKGLPVLDKYLRVGRSEFFVMGGYAALQVGPVARNLAGARKASELIVAGLTKYSRL